MESPLDQRLDIHETLEQWRQSITERAALRISTCTLDTCADWCLSEGRLKHATGRFFQVSGVTWHDVTTQHAPLLEQREIGTLATVIRHRNNQVELLVQAKVEPGNMYDVQYAPTAQATASNADRIHGGSCPVFSDYFAAGNGRIVADSLQSEQGLKFLGKQNRNLTVCDEALETSQPLHRWVPFQIFRSLLVEDFKVNTDLRSVLCVSDWNVLAGGRPFSGTDRLSTDLRASFMSEQRQSYFQEILKNLLQARKVAPRVTAQPITALQGWTFRTDHALALSSAKGAIKMIHVEVETREVDAWDQPIFETSSDQIVDLNCRVMDGYLRFQFIQKWEPGLLKKVELAPTSQVDWTKELAQEPSCLSAWNSDEGSRFFRDNTLYRIIRDRGAEFREADVWLSLSEIHTLLKLGAFNNEARSAISLVISKL
jgi:dTDP-4-dehydro-6-deoxy-alpha-D-glucopyranose 2,3-dehydratase